MTTHPRKHSPGPYLCERYRDGCDDVIQIKAADGSYVADITYWDEPDTDDAAKAEADALLLSAAPELLAALEHALEYLKANGDGAASTIAVVSSAIARTLPHQQPAPGEE